MVHFFDLFSKNKTNRGGHSPEKPVQSAEGSVNACSAPASIDDRQQPLAVLKQFVPIRNLDDSSVRQLPHTTKAYTADSVIFVQGQCDDCVHYLLEGVLELSPDSDSTYRISAGSTHSHLPLNSGKFCGASAVALTDVKILDVSAELLQLWTQQSEEQLSTVELVDLELPLQFANNRFFSNFAQMYRENKLALPTLPTVAIKLKEAMNEEIDMTEAARIIQIDPSIAAKLIQVTNSPLYSPVTPINNCHDAIVRMGLNATRTLVMSISLKQMFQCKDQKLLKAMRNLWHDSLYLSGMCFILAQESAAINPEDALLAGLISDIGVLPLLHFAEHHPDQFADLTELEQVIPYLRAPLGTLVLHTLGFSEQLTQIPHHAEDWYFESGDRLKLIDIVILAKLHSYIGREKHRELPYINSIPAYSKLNDSQLNPDFSLKVLHKAQQRIDAVLQILA